MSQEHMYLKESVFVGSLLLNFTSVFVSLGVFIFGFEQGVMSSLLTNKYFKQYYNEPTPFEIGTMIAILEVGALFSSVVAGKVGDKIGRRRTIRYGAFIFAFGGLIQATSINIFTLSVGRLISGIAIGLLTTIIPCYQSEISPPEDRGFYGCLEFSGNIVGYSSSIWVDYGFSFIESNVSWRSPLFVQFLIGTLLWSGSFIIVETPRWLLDHNHDCEGMIVIADLYADGDILDDHAKSEYRNIKESVLLARIEGGERSYQYLFTKYTKRLSVACFSQMFAQMNGINIISYYAPMIFESAGWIGRQAILMTGINSIIYFLATIPPWFLVDDWGRKPLLMSGALLMGIPLYIVAWSLWKSDEHTPSIVVVSIIITNAAFGYSWGPIPWLMSEVFPNSVRSKGAAMSTATNWLFNFIVGEMTPILLHSIQWRTYLIPATSCMLSFFCVHFLFPETKGLSLEDMGSVFDDNSSVFSFHSSGVRSNDESRSRSFSVDTSAMNQSAASLARNPANMAFPDGIIGSIPSIPVPSSVSGKLDASSDALVSDSVPVEVEPPSPEEIMKFKKEENANSIFSFLFSRSKQTDETTRLLA